MPTLYIIHSVLNVMVTTCLWSLTYNLHVRIHAQQSHNKLSNVFMVIYKDHITIQRKVIVSHIKKSVNKQEKLCTVIWRLDYFQYTLIDT